MLISVATDLHGTIYLQRERIKAQERRIQKAQDLLNTLLAERNTAEHELKKAQAYEKVLQNASIEESNILEKIQALPEQPRKKVYIETIEAHLEQYKAKNATLIFQVKGFQNQLTTLELKIDAAKMDIQEKIAVLEALKSAQHKTEEKLQKKQQILSLLESKQPGFFAQRRLEQEALVKELIPPIVHDLMHHFPNLNQNEWDHPLRKSHANSPRRR